MDWQKLGTALSGMGAGFSGQGPSWQAAQVATRKQADESRLQRDAELREQLLRDAFAVDSYLNVDDVDSARYLLTDRLDKLRAQGVDSSDTFAVLDLLNKGETEAAHRQVKTVVDYANQFGVGLGANRTPAGVLEFEALTQGFSPEEKANAQRVAVGIAPRAQGRVTTMIGGVPHVVDRAAGMAYSIIDGSGVPITAEMVADNQAVVSAGSERGKQSVQKAGEIFEKLRPVEVSMANLAKARNAIKRGADTGFVAEMFPSITEASVTLDNVRNQMGLDIVGATTFGALSESELEFALSTAMPTGLGEQELDAWLAKKETAQKKYHKELVKAAVWLQRNPEKGIGGYVEYLKDTGQLEFGENESAYQKWLKAQGAN